MRRLAIAIILAAIAIGVWLAVSILPWRAASPDLVESARLQIDASDAELAKFINAALDRTKLKVVYDGAYTPIGYPGGDVPPSIGVCTDEVIRTYRAIGIDLQPLVHEDMKKNFGDYPKLWNLKAPDPHIDHRRVPNLQTYFTRHSASLPISEDPADYRPGDLVTCMVRGNRPHIAIVVPAPKSGDRPWIMHNCGFGPKMEDKLFTWKLTGHYRWHPTTR